MDVLGSTVDGFAGPFAGSMTYCIRRDAETVHMPLRPAILDLRHVLHSHLNSHANRPALT
jgi:hypothetical protein